MRGAATLSGVGGVIALLTVCGSALGADVSGVQFTDRGATGEISPGNIRGSLGVIDFDNDGWQDLFVNNDAGAPKRLFRNVPSSTVPGGRTLVDVTASAGLSGDADGVARGGLPVVVFDYNNDGFADIWAAGVGSGTVGTLYRNNGNATFSNVSVASGVRQSGLNPLCASAVDFDHDGATDLMIASSGVAAARTVVLLRNNGNGTFTPRPDLLPPISFTGVIYAMGFMDYDRDGWEDALVLTNAGRPLMLKNVAATEGGRRFVDSTTASGFTTVGPAPMGIAFGDVNNDGWLDVAITDASVGTYYENRSGTLVRTYPYSTFFGWGTTYIDADNDGRVDNYQAGSFGRAAVSWLLLNRPGQQVDARAALNTPALASQQCARIDIDNDGREDIITVNPGSFISVLHNQTAPANRWFKVRLSGGNGVNADAVGAVVRVFAAGTGQVRQVALGTSYGASEDARAHFGLGQSAAVDRVEVVWPRGGTLRQRTDVFAGPFTADQIVTLTPRVRCDADFDRSGVVAVNDIFGFLSIWFAGESDADFNADGVKTVDDLLAYLNAWFARC